MNQGKNQGRPVIFVLDRLVVEDDDDRREHSSPQYAAKAHLEVLKRLLNSHLASSGRLGPIYLNIEGRGVFRMFPSQAEYIDFQNLRTRGFGRLLGRLFQRGEVCGRPGIPAIRKISHRLSALFPTFTVIGCVSGVEFNHLKNMRDDYNFAPDTTYVFVIGKLIGGGIDDLITEYLQALDIPITSAETFAGWVCDELEDEWNL